MANCFLYLFSKEASFISGSYSPWTILAWPSAEKAAQLGHDSLHCKHRLCPFPTMLSVQKPAECLDLSQQETMNHKDKAQLLWHPLRVCSRGKAGPKTMPSLAPLQASWEGWRLLRINRADPAWGVCCLTMTLALNSNMYWHFSPAFRSIQHPHTGRAVKHKTKIVKTN